VSEFKFSTATEWELETLIMWMENNHDSIGDVITSELAIWIEDGGFGGVPYQDRTTLDRFLGHFEKHIENGVS